jgi:hypothetical protein
MRALHLYFAETADPDSRSSSATDGMPLVDDGPLTPIQPGAFSRWMASRERTVAEFTKVRSAFDGSQLASRPYRLAAR